MMATKQEILPPLTAKGFRRAGGLAKREQSTVRFTEKAIDRLPSPHPSGAQRLYWDDEIKGFGVLVSGTTKTKTYVVQHKLAGGKTRRVTVGPVNVWPLDKAREQAKIILAQFYTGTDPKAARYAADSEKMTLREALDGYLKGRKRLRQSSAQSYRYSVERYLSDWLDKPLRQITSQKVEMRHGEIASNIDLGDKKNASRSVKITGNAAANGAMRALRAIWNFHAKRVPEGALSFPYNPVSRLSDTDAWHPVEKRERAVKADRLQDFYKAADALGSEQGLQLDDRAVKNRTIADYLKFLLFTGMRRSEAASLRWDDLDWTDKVITVPAVRTKGGRKLDLPMTDYVHQLMSARKEIGCENEFVFAATSQSGHIEEPKFGLSLIHKATGIRVSAHDLRRTFVTQAGRAGISPLDRKALVNHSMGGSDITEGYDQVSVDDLREPAQRVTDRLKKLCGVKGISKAKQKSGHGRGSRSDARHHIGSSSARSGLSSQSAGPSQSKTCPINFSKSARHLASGGN
ncbi:MAG TPA: tyrosine-type recombinase/integrase [Rhizomicrobium sp.]|jgi:integrase|nr:tyrosine-type recombinase/integrase [Rhizomicrobium sp.]